MPSVAIKGGILNLAINQPLIAPHNTPTARATTMGTITGTTRPGYFASCQSGCWARLAAKTAARANTDPDDRSIPVVMMTIVTPMAIKPTTEICRTTLTKFRGCRNASVRNVIATNMAIKISTMAYFLTNAFNDSRLKLCSKTCGGVVLAIIILLPHLAFMRARSLVESERPDHVPSQPA